MQQGFESIIRNFSKYAKSQGQDDVSATIVAAGLRYRADCEEAHKQLKHEGCGQGSEAAECLDNLGIIYRGLGHLAYLPHTDIKGPAQLFSIALEKHQQALKIRLSSRPIESVVDPAVATSETHIGTAHLAQSEHEEALECFFNAKRIWEKLAEDDIGMNKNVAACQNSIGLVHLSQGWNQMARECFERALAIDLEDEQRGETLPLRLQRSELPPVRVEIAGQQIDLDLNSICSVRRVDRTRAGSSHLNRGTALLNLGKLDEAYANYNTALQKYEEATHSSATHHDTSVAKCLWGMRLIHEKKREHVKAMELYRRQQNIIHSLPNALPEVASRAQLDTWQESVQVMVHWQAKHMGCGELSGSKAHSGKSRRRR